MAATATAVQPATRAVKTKSQESSWMVNLGEHYSAEQWSSSIFQSNNSTRSEPSGALVCPRREHRSLIMAISKWLWRQYMAPAVILLCDFHSFFIGSLRDQSVSFNTAIPPFPLFIRVSQFWKLIWEHFFGDVTSCPKYENQSFRDHLKSPKFRATMSLVTLLLIKEPRNIF